MNIANLVLIPVKLGPELTNTMQPDGAGFYRNVTPQPIGVTTNLTEVAAPVGPQRWPVKM